MKHWWKFVCLKTWDALHLQVVREDFPVRSTSRITFATASFSDQCNFPVFDWKYLIESYICHFSAAQLQGQKSLLVFRIDRFSHRTLLMQENRSFKSCQVLTPPWCQTLPAQISHICWNILTSLIILWLVTGLAQIDKNSGKIHKENF